MNVFTHFMRLNTYRLLLPVAMVLAAFSSNLNAQCSLACKGDTQVSLDMNCQATITPQMILNDETTSCPGAGTFVVSVEDALTEIPIPTSPMVTSAEVGKTLIVRITEPNSGNSCWGYITVEDKLGPVPECPTDPIVIGCTELIDYSGPVFRDGCEGIVPAELIAETITPLDCDPDYIKTIERVYTAHDAGGFPATSNCTVIINVERIALDQVICPVSYQPNVDPLLSNTLNCDGTWDCNDSDCEFYGFTGQFAESEANGSVTAGDGTDASAEFAGHTLTLTATTDGTLNTDTDYDLCYNNITCDGNLQFSWAASMIDAGANARFLNDEFAYVLNGTEVILVNTDLQSETGFTTIPVSAGDDFCFRVSSMNRAAYTQVVISNFALSGQIGIVLDTDTDGDGINDTESNCRWDDNDNGYPDVFETGVPTLLGRPLFPTPDVYCNAGTFFTDVEIPTNSECKRKIMRMWEVREWWCADEIVRACTQIIEITDDEAPVLTCTDTEECVGYTKVTTNTHTYDVATAHGTISCGANYSPELPGIVDNCSTEFTIDASWTHLDPDVADQGIVKNYNGTQSLELMMGLNEITFTVYDGCYNSSECSFIVEVVDNTPPTAICDEYTVVGLTSEGTAFAYAETFDDGSHDDCIVKKQLVRRMDTPCGDCDAPIYPDMEYLGEYNGHHYYVSKEEVNWYQARDLSEAMGGYLVRLNDMGESDWVYNEAQAYDMNQYYIDLSDQDCDGDFEDSEGNIPTYTNWANNQPNGSGQFVLFRRNTSFWNDVRGEERRERYVMEVEDPCTFSHKAKFCCADIGTDVMVVYRVIDLYGNWNECMVTVEVQDKLAPDISCPADITVDCDTPYDLDNLSEFGVATAIDNCEDIPVVEVAVDGLNQCNIGVITRTFTATDGGGTTAQCIQRITFEEDDPFDGNDIVWPTSPYDLLECATPDDVSPDVTGRPTFIEDQCDLVGANYEDEVFYFNNTVGNACFKILRTWRVIDWCQLIDTDGDGIGDVNPIWTRTQTIKVVNTVDPVFDQECEDLWVCTYDADCSGGYIELTKSATDDCTLLDNLAWTAEIDLNATNGSFDEANITETTTGGSIDVSDTYPVGTHVIRWTVLDKCGNIATCDQVFKIVNCKAPTPYCLNGLAVDLMPMDTDNDGEADTGMVELWASDFDNGSSHPCGYDVVTSFTPDHTVTNMTFNCTTLGEQSVNIYVTALDANGQPLEDHDGNVIQAFCTTFVDIQDNMNVCSESPTDGAGGSNRIAGTVETADGKMISDVVVDLQGGDVNSTTNQDGAYQFPTMVDGGNYAVVPALDDVHSRAVSTLDIILIQRHILDIELLDSPYKLIAADANKDGNISAADITDIRRLILEYYNEFPNNAAWRFVDKNYVFVDATQPNAENFDESYEIIGLNSDMNIDFIAMKTGDVNLSVDVVNRSNEVFGMTLGNATVSNDVALVPVYASDLTTISGYQFGIKYNGNAQILGLESGAIDITTDNYRLTKDGVTISYNSDVAQTYGADEALFYIAANGDVDASRFDIDTDAINAEVYNETLEVLTPSFAVANDNGFALLQNTPNPFKGNTTISFRLPTAMDAILTVRDMSGKLVYNQTIAGNKGMNNVVLDNPAAFTSGVMYYTVKAGEFTQTRKMVVLK